jgi:hypothetical protein
MCNMGGWSLPQSIWYNPFSVAQYGLEGALLRYREYLEKRPDLIALLPTLKGKTLGCWCKKPKTPNVTATSWSSSTTSSVPKIDSDFHSCFFNKNVNRLVQTSGRVSLPES